MENEKGCSSTIKKRSKNKGKEGKECEEEENFGKAEGCLPDVTQQKALASGVTLCSDSVPLFIFWDVFPCHEPTNIFGKIFHILEFIGGIFEITDWFLPVNQLNIEQRWCTEESAVAETFMHESIHSFFMHL